MKPIPFYNLLNSIWPATTHRATISSNKTGEVHVRSGLQTLDSLDYPVDIDREQFTTYEPILDKDKAQKVDDNGELMTKPIFDEDLFNAATLVEKARQTDLWGEAVRELRQMSEDGVA